MKNIGYYIFIFAALAASSCAKTELLEGESAGEGQELKGRVVFSANLEGPAKANLDAYPGVTWEYTDVVKVYNGASSADFTPVEGSIDGSNVELEGDITLGEGNTYALCPASAALSHTGDKVTVKLPERQYVKTNEHLDQSALLAAAVTSGKSLYFRNICAIVKVSVTGSDVTGIVLEGNNGEYLSGTAEVTLTEGGVPVINVTDGKTLVDLRPDGFGTFAPGEYYIPVFPTALTGGIKAGCQESTIGTTTSFTLARNGGREFAGIDVTASGKTAQLLVRQFADIYEAGQLGLSEKLANDIDMAGQSVEGCTFKGSFDGDNHKIYNCLVVGSTKACLFTDIIAPEASGTKYEITNVKFGTKDGSTYDGVSNITCTTTAATTIYAGLIGVVEDGVDLSLSGVENFVPVYINKGAADPSTTYVSAICAYSSGKISFSNVKNNGSIIKNTTKGSIFAGAILSCTDYGGEILFENCENNAQIKCDAATTGSTYLGGFVAKAVATGNVLQFTNCTNNGYIYNSNGGGTVYVAGFVGNGGTGSGDGVVGSLKFNNCTNNGKIYNKVGKGMRLGGFVGSIYGSFTATDCTNNGPIVVDKATTDTRVGGFVGGNTGTAKSGNLTRCINTSTGTISVTGGSANFNAYVAGFVGQYQPQYTFTDCENYGDILINNGGKTCAESCAGGFAGKHDKTKTATISGGISSCSINSTSATTLNCGILFGYGYTLAATKAGVAGSVNGTVLDSSNWTDKLFGGYGKTATGVKTTGTTACYLINSVAVKIGTFNLWSPNAREDDLASGKTSEARLWPCAVGSIATTINVMDCDIIAFNEVHSKTLDHPDLSENEEMIARVNALNGNKYIWCMKFPNYDDGRYSFCNGFAYDATKLEIVEEPVKAWLQGDATTITTTAIDGGRTIIYVKFKEKSSNKEFWFAVTHLNLGDDGGPSLYNAKCCVNWAKSVVNHTLPCILVGDMNCATVTTRPSTMVELKTYWSDSYDEAKTAGILDSDNTAKPATRPGTSKVGTGTESELSSLAGEANRYDHIMVDHVTVSSYSCIRDLYPAEKGATGDFWPSDHFPIMVTVQI